MNREELDRMWNKALADAIRDGEEFTRYHFAALVAAHEREACAKICEEVGNEPWLLTINHARECVARIRARSEQ